MNLDSYSPKCGEGEFYEVRAPYYAVDFIMCLGRG